MATSETTATGSTTHQVHSLATVSAVVSAIGLVAFNLIGLILSVVALRQMDRAPNRYHGYRLVFTGWLLGLIGVAVYPLFLLRAHNAYGTPDFAGALGLTLTAMVLTPIVLLIYAWQDRLPEARTFTGYAWLGTLHQRSHLDFILGAAMIATSLLLLLAEAPNIPMGSLFLIVGLVGPWFKRRGMRTLMIYLFLAYIIQAACTLVLA
jgi:uncharacterized membrane protein